MILKLISPVELGLWLSLANRRTVWENKRMGYKKGVLFLSLQESGKLEERKSELFETPCICENVVKQCIDGIISYRNMLFNFNISVIMSTNIIIGCNIGQQMLQAETFPIKYKYSLCKYFDLLSLIFFCL